MGFRINTVTIDGNLTKDPELRSLPSGQSVCNLRIAHNSRRKDGNTGEWTDQPNFFSVTVWGGEGEWIAKNLGKGAKVVVQGELRWREYEARDGGKREAIDINATNVVSAQAKGEGGGGFTARSDIPTDLPEPSYAGGGGGRQPQDDVPF